MSAVLSAEKLNMLRAVAGPSLPDSKLRAALIGAAGDLNLAASRLLCHLQPHPQPPRPPPSASASAAKVATAIATVTATAPATAEQPPLTPAHVRRLAWRTFYSQHYHAAVSAVGSDKSAVDAHIVALWKKLGSHARRAFTADVQRQLERESLVDTATHHEPRDATNPPHHPVAHAEAAHSPAPPTSLAESPLHRTTHTHNSASPGEPPAAPSPALGVAPSPPPKARAAKPHSAQTKSNHQAAQPQPRRQTAQSALPSPNPSPPLKPPPCARWPRVLVTRSASGIMLTSGRNLLNVGDKLQLSVPPARASKSSHKKNPLRLVRFSSRGREVGRLAPDLAHALAPALQSDLVVASATVIWAPSVIRMFTQVDLEVSILIKREAFRGNDSMVEAGLEADGEGIDAKRVNVVSMISALKLCEQPPENSKQEDGGAASDSLNAQDPGVVDEKAVESYYKTVQNINENEAAKYKPPKSLSCSLREYQRVGVLWMTAQEKHGRSVRDLSPSLLNPMWRKCVFPDGGMFYMNPTTGCLSLDSPITTTGGPYGGILADEMGLGKTVQCIACILHDMEDQASALTPLNREDKIAQNIASVEHSAVGSNGGSASIVKEENSTCEHDGKVRVKAGHADSINEASDSREQVTKRLLHQKSETQKIANVNGGRKINKDSTLVTSRLASLRSRARLAKRKLPERSSDSELRDDGPHTESQASHINNIAGKDGEELELCANSDEDWVDVKQLPTPSKRKRLKKFGPPLSAISMLMGTNASKKASLGGTLIVCPTSLVTQWINQFHQHVIPNSLRVSTHYGQGRGDSRSISLLGADVVVTSYGTLAAECSEETSNGEEVGPRDGPLFHLHWRRIVLDEAHTIKSRVTKWARASYKIRAERRWCVTGTVIHNHVNDVFSLLHFLDVKPWSSWAFWNRVIVSNLESNNIELQRTAMSLIRDIISSVTLRRKKTTRDSKGRCIVQLTKKNVTLVELTPSSQERDFYSAIHQRSKLQFDTFLAQDKVMHNYASVLELLLRLRQACDHPYLVFAAAPSKDSVVMKDRDKLFKQFMEAGSSAEYIEKVFKDAQSGSMGKSSQCPICLDIIDDPVAPKGCGHPACRGCMMESLKRASKCPVCRIPINREDVVTLPRGNRFSVDLSKKWRSSAKIDELLKDVRKRQKLREESKGRGVGKTVIFSQFTAMLDLVGIALDRENFRWLRIDGSVPQAQRALILERFENESELSRDSSNVLLVSLRAGGVGLNLITASFAILLDIHWNPQVDLQAQDRIHRHGQTRDVLIKRYIIKDSVEEKLLKVQSRKQSIADGALEVTTDEHKKQAKLSELKLLFSAS